MVAARNSSLLPTFIGHCRSLIDCTLRKLGDGNSGALLSAVARWNRRSVIDVTIADDLCRIRRANKTVITHDSPFSPVFAALCLGLAVRLPTLVRVAILALRRSNASAPNLWTAV
ncbi:MAG TPA: hypothetical protein VMH26_08145, partial [Burkholderiales bacterium]|nr:hypothetical protein [Burkholderiales bacterium]